MTVRERAGRVDTWREVVPRWLASYTSANTRVAYEADLRHFLEWCRALRVDPMALDDHALPRAIGLHVKRAGPGAPP